MLSRKNIKYLILCFSQHILNYCKKNMQNKHYNLLSVTATPSFTKNLWKLKQETDLIFKLRIPVKSHITPIFCDYLMHTSVISLTFLLV